MQDACSEAATAAEERTGRRRQIYGRRVGRALTPELDGLLKEALPRLRLSLDAPAPPQLSSLFPIQVKDVWLEVGFGGGEHLAWQAANNPHVGIIGCEPFLTGIAKLLREVHEADLANIRIHDDDARQLLHWLPDASIGRAFVLFPDPWPKKRHRKRRILQGEVLDNLARALRKGSQLRFATDIADYANMVTQAMAARTDFAPRAHFIDERPSDWPATRYEAKAIHAGRKRQFFIFERV
jgi:tRNA (guanine-N7-)-methyltransferase